MHDLRLKLQFLLIYNKCIFRLKCVAVHFRSSRINQCIFQVRVLLFKITSDAIIINGIQMKIQINFSINKFPVRKF